MSAEGASRLFPLSLLECSELLSFAQLRAWRLECNSCKPVSPTSHLCDLDESFNLSHSQPISNLGTSFHRIVIGL